MITLTIHCRGREPVMRKFTALPPVGSFLDLDSGLHRVDAVVFRQGGATWADARPTVYTVAVSSERADELRKAWANAPKRKDTE